MKTHLVLSGGGIYGVYMLGALKELCKSYTFTHICGTSVGALIGCLLCVMDIQDIIDLITSNKLIEDDDINLKNIYIEYGFLTPHTLLHLASTILKNKTGYENVTFKELFKLSKINIYVTGTNLSLNCSDVFSHIHTPNMSVLKAIEISISIPCIFTKVEYNNNVYVDGGVTNMYPANVFKQVKEDKVLCLYVLINSHTQIKNVFDYFTALVSTILSHQTVDNALSNYDTIKFESNNNISLLNYTSEDIKMMLNDGTIKALNFLKKIT